MSVTVFSSTGCIRCAIVKKHLQDRGTLFTEYNVKTDAGNEAFKVFYRAHRSEIRRDENGVFFPVVADGDRVVQDAGAALAWFMCNDCLADAVSPSSLGHGWIGGLDISACQENTFEVFLEVLRLLKSGGLATELCSNGKNAALLRNILQEKLADRLKFKLAAGQCADRDVAASLRAAKEHAGKTELLFLLDIQGAHGPAAPADAAETAKLMAEATGDNRLPLSIFNSDAAGGVNLFPYRTESRRWQVLADLA